MTCDFCGGTFPAFLEYGVPPRPGRCPLCSSKGRHRALALFARERLLGRLGKGAEVLDVGPTHMLLEHTARLWSGAGARYTTIDIREPHRAKKLKAPNRFIEMDARRMDFPSDSFDLVVCANMLSFVREDREIMSEIRRVVKPDGLAILTVYRIPGPTLSVEDYCRLHPGLTREYLESNGTAWYYGDDYLQRLGEVGFEAVDIARPVKLEASAAKEKGLEKQPTLTLAARGKTTLSRWVDSSAIYGGGKGGVRAADPDPQADSP